MTMTTTAPKKSRVHPSVPALPASTDHEELVRLADVVLLNTSAGKDSQAMASYIVSIAKRLRMLHKIVMVHADLGDIEWSGTRDLAERQGRLLGVTRFKVVQAAGGDLLARTEARYIKLKTKSIEEGKPLAPAWPSSSARWCTSDLKRGPIRVLMTRLVDELAHLGRPVRILNCLGQRAAESAHRAKLAPVEIDKAASNGRRHVTTLRPIHAWSDRDVWAEIARSGLPYHDAYDWGMRRLSCSFCVLACESDLVLAARLRPEKAAEYIDMENKVEKDFKKGMAMRDIVARARVLNSMQGPVRKPPRGSAMAAHIGWDATRAYLKRLRRHEWRGRLRTWLTIAATLTTALILLTR